MLDVRIRKTKLSDYEDIKAIYSEIGILHQNMRPDVFNVSTVLELSKEYFEEIVKTHYMLSAVVIVKDKERVVGFLDAIKKDYAYSKESSLFISELGVREKYRKLGIGSSLMEKAEAFAKKNGLFVALNVWHTNRKAMAFYEHLGYVPRTVVLEKKINDIFTSQNELE